MSEQAPFSQPMRLTGSSLLKSKKQSVVICSSGLRATRWVFAELEGKMQG